MALYEKFNKNPAAFFALAAVACTFFPRTVRAGFSSESVSTSRTDAVGSESKPLAQFFSVLRSNALDRLVSDPSSQQVLRGLQRLDWSDEEQVVMVAPLI